MVPVYLSSFYLFIKRNKNLSFLGYTDLLLMVTFDLFWYSFVLATFDKY